MLKAQNRRTWLRNPFPSRRRPFHFLQSRQRLHVPSSRPRVILNKRTAGRGVRIDENSVQHRIIRVQPFEGLARPSDKLGPFADVEGESEVLRALVVHTHEDSPEEKLDSNKGHE